MSFYHIKRDINVLVTCQRPFRNRLSPWEGKCRLQSVMIKELEQSWQIPRGWGEESFFGLR